MIVLNALFTPMRRHLILYCWASSPSSRKKPFVSVPVQVLHFGLYKSPQSGQGWWRRFLRLSWGWEDFFARAVFFPCGTVGFFASRSISSRNLVNRNLTLGWIDFPLNKLRISFTFAAWKEKLKVRGGLSLFTI